MFLYLSFIGIQRFSNNSSICGYRMFTVATGSMVPVYEVGDVIVVKETTLKDLKVGDDVTYYGIKNDFKDSPITLKWFDLEQVGYYDLSLIDLDTNQTIDIYNTADYTFELEKGGIRHFKLIAEVNADKGRFFKK